MNANKRLKTFGPFAFVLLLAAALPASARIQESYGYLRVLEGSADVVQAGSSDAREDRGDQSAEINQPILAGDRIRLADRSRVEVVLADRNLLRVDGGSDLVFERLANSPDTSDRRTVLRLLEGNLQLVVTTDAEGEDLPRIETPNATITIENPGVYRITAERDGWTQLVVRRGSAQVDSEDGETRVRAGDELVVENGQGSGTEAQEAEGFDSLERWAGRLDSDYGDDDDRYIQDQDLRYAAQPLSRYGSWITYESRSYWRPRGVASDWRPYWQGRWAYTPSGLTWVSNEPWGWVPYHYGSWDYLPTYGWAWQPGYVYAPAHVYWYWGSDYVGWCPTGYYTRYYGNRFGSGFRFGVYGWANAGWGHYQRWNFVRPDHFGRRDQNRYAVPVDRYGRNGDGHAAPGRGIITTDTRPLKPELWRKPQEAVRTLSGWRGVDEGGRAVGGKAPRELPDVTSFIARKPQLSPTEARNVAADRDANSLDRMQVKPIATGRSPIEIGGGGGSRWSQPGTQGRQGQREEREAGQGGTRPQGSEKPAPGGNGVRPARPNDAMDSGDSGGRWSTRGGKPRAEGTAPTQETTGTWRDRRPREVEVPRNDQPRQPQAETPSWRKPATEEKPAPSGEAPPRSWRTEDRNRESAGDSGVRPETRVRPKPESSGEGDGGSGYRNDRSHEGPRPSNDRPTYVRPAPSRERSPEPAKPVYRPSPGSSSDSSGSGGSSHRERTVQPKPAESPRPQAAPKESGGRGNNNGGGGSGSKEKPRERKPPAESDGGDGGNG